MSNANLHRASSILIVDSKRAVARSLQKSLTSIGYYVPVTVNNGDEALRVARVYRPDLVLMDPHITGTPNAVETAARLCTSFGAALIYTHEDHDCHQAENMQASGGQRLSGSFPGSPLASEVSVALQVRACLSQQWSRDLQHSHETSYEAARFSGRRPSDATRWPESADQWARSHDNRRRSK